MEPTFRVVSKVASISSHSWSEPRCWHSHGPVDDEGVDVIQPQVLQGGLQVNADMLGSVIGIPELCLDEQVLPDHQYCSLLY